MIRLLVMVLGAVAMFAAGFFGVDRYEIARSMFPIHLAPPSDPAVYDPWEPIPEGKSTADSPIAFEDVAKDSGLDFTYYDGAEGKFHIVETVGAGAAVFDYDNDDRQDIFLVNGCLLPRERAGRQHRSQFYRNRRAGSFEDVTDLAIGDLIAYGHGAACGDFDSDGFDDLFVGSFGECYLFRNQGDGTFAQIARTAGMISDRWATCSVFGDFDVDGDLDLYVSTYSDVDIANPLICGSPKRAHCDPARYVPQPDLLFRNDGAGHFDEVSKAAGTDDATGRGLGLAVADFNNDDRPDIFVANDGSDAYLFQNRGDFRFENRAIELGAALNGMGNTMSAMGVGCADYDDNGLPDLCVSDFWEQTNVLFRNMGPAGFVDEAGPAGIAVPSRDRTSWGNIFLDADLDAYLDLFIATGHVSDIENVPYHMRPLFHHNRGDGTFEDLTDSVGLYFQRELLGRGVAQGDFNSDGLADLVVSNIGDRAALLINQTRTKGHWLGLELVGTRSNRNGYHVKVRMKTGERQRYFERVSGAAYMSSSDQRLLIGLGTADKIDELLVRWPSGSEQSLANLALGRYHLVVEPSRP